MEVKTRVAMQANLQTIHPSLLLHKLGLHVLTYDEFDRDTLKIGKPENGGYIGDKRTVLDELVKSVQDGDFRNTYNDFYTQWQNYLKERALVLEAKTGARFISGLSYGAAMHIGFSLHHTYGVPYIPGSTVKGACKAIAKQEALEMEQAEQDAELALIQRIYGDENTNGKAVFLDVFPQPLSKKISLMLDLDVITPHHTKANADEAGYETAPDIEEPVPVEFAVVPEGMTYCFGFICPNEADREIVTKHWQTACDEGFGAKTSSGYGSFIPQEQKEEKQEEISPKTILKDFKMRVESNKSGLNNMLSGFVDQIYSESTPEEIKKEMAALLVKRLSPKKLKQKVKKGNKTAIRLDQILRS
ncbi:type III-B CRISPR module RAMP protein Cmr6 [Marinifilum sp. JC120]|nr:type III-B CRISPR module RAMP protein Cmr6 [Marinifilum sp. JC120]